MSSNKSYWGSCWDLVIWCQHARWRRQSRLVLSQYPMLATCVEEYVRAKSASSIIDHHFSSLRSPSDISVISLPSAGLPSTAVIVKRTLNATASVRWLPWCASSGLHMLIGGTFRDGAYFRGAFSRGQETDLKDHGWHSYDGLSGHRLEGPLAPMTLHGSCLSYVVYRVRWTTIHKRSGSSACVDTQRCMIWCNPCHSTNKHTFHISLFLFASSPRHFFFIAPSLSVARYRQEGYE